MAIEIVDLPMKITGWWLHTFFIFHFIYGMSPLPLTNSIIFPDGYCTTSQNSRRCPQDSVGFPLWLAFLATKADFEVELSDLRFGDMGFLLSFPLMTPNLDKTATLW